jgi:NAD(P)-dependent dehydrogenase (short-subunit alcohol dehydrogenase family)
MTAGTLAGKTILMSGGSRGIGLAIALRARTGKRRSSSRSPVDQFAADKRGRH